MLRTLLSGVAKARLALWAIEQVIPDSTDLSLRLKSGLFGIIAAVAAGVLAASLAVVGLVAFGVAAHIYAGFSMGQSVVATVGITVTLIIMLVAYGREKFSECLAGLSPARADRHIKPSLGEDVMQGFVSGLLASPAAKPAAKPLAKSPATHAKPAGRA